MERLECQVQGLVTGDFPVIAECEVLVVQQGFTQWFLQTFTLLGVAGSEGQKTLGDTLPGSTLKKAF